MPMTIAVTRNVPGRFRGLLASCMCEIAPGVYTAPRMSAGVRERLWTVLEEWWMAYPEGSVLMTWPDASLPGGQNLRSVGLPRQDLRDHYGVFLARRIPGEKSPTSDDAEQARHENEGAAPSSVRGQTTGEGTDETEASP
ncbi:MAG: type I-E CRISPR-associated endoribonuclease Cas2e [Acidobacteriota bacterium]